MTRLNSTFLLRRASERLSAGAAAVVLTALTLMLLSVDVHAAEPAAGPSSITVKYQEIAFDTADGAAAVYRKLKFAARRVCGVNSGDSLTLDRRVAVQSCYEKTLADAVHNIDRPMLTYVHANASHKLG